MDLSNQLRQDLVQISYHSVVGHFEYRRIRILVDRNDDLGLFHSM